METGIVANVRKIAVLRANALGDFIFALPALEALRRAYPQAEICYLGRPWHERFLAGRPGPVDRVTVVPVSEGVREEPGLTEDPAELDAFFARMQAERFDLGIQIHGGGRHSNPFLRRLGARVTAGLQTPDAPRLDRSVPYVYYQNEALRYLEVAATVGARTERLEPGLAVTTADLEEAQSVLREEERFVVLHPGATDRRRQWPPERFGAIARYLSGRGYRVLVSGSGPERGIVDAVVGASVASAEPFFEQVSLGGLAGVLSRATLVIANDTGPLHLAGAVGTPTVGLYWCGNLINGGPATRTWHRPLVSWIVECPLCGANMGATFPFQRGRRRCDHGASFVAGIGVEEAQAAADALLEQLSARDPDTVTPVLPP